MAAFAGALYTLEEDGSLTNTTTGAKSFLSTTAPAITRTVKNSLHAYYSAKAVMILMAQMIGVGATPISAILPTIILDIIGDDAASDLAIRYRRYVRTTLVPLMRRIVDILQAHGVVMELPPKTWYEQNFSGENWVLIGTDFYQLLWIAVTISWERLLLQWADGDYSNHLAPTNQMPVGGLRAVLTWSVERGKQKQMELIGMTRADEEDVSEVFQAFFSGDLTKAGEVAAANRAARMEVSDELTFEQETKS